jgi:O-antigen/teichoic acid export membrane protein
VRSLQQRIAASETAKAAGLAGAALAANAVAVIVTVVFTRLLGDDGYGALAALMSSFTILAVAGSALQVAVARDTALGRLGGAAGAVEALRGWTRALLIVLVAVAAASVLLREHIAALMGVREEPWAAAFVAPGGVLWLLLSLQRGVLQGLGAYTPVGASVVLEAVGRLVAGCALVLLGADVAGAFLGTPVTMAVTALVLARVLHARAATDGTRASPAVDRLRDLVRSGWAPIAGLLLLAALQNVDVIMAKREMPSGAAGAYAAAVVAAKLVVWTAIGIGLHLLPEATRRAAAGDDPRPVLVRALGLLAVVAVPSLAIFAIAPETLLRVAFGEDFVGAADALLVLGLAMTLLAVSTLAVQYMLALHRTAFLWVLGLVAIAEPLLLSRNDPGIRSFAAIVLALQCVAAVSSLALGLRARPRVIADAAAAARGAA